MLVHDECAEWTAVYRCRESRACHERALILDAVAIDYRLVQDDEGYSLRVSARDAPKAGAELADYDAENEGWPPTEDSPARIASGVSGALGYGAVLLAVFGFAQREAFSLDWWGAGAMQAMLVREGEWWRTVTALSLHTDVPHLLGNLVFGALLGAFLCHQLGTGVAWGSILLAGAVGNFVNALVQSPLHTSVGASTAVFGAMGIVVGLQWVRRGSSTHRRLRRWAPLIIGAVFLGYLGTSGARTDVVAHLTGMTSGVLLGLLLGTMAGRRPLAARPQIVLAWMSPLLLALSWVLALSRS
ncbi:MAG: rhomboid family intramembrane serine protease [Candidatus Methylomirabilia bacterium]